MTTQYLAKKLARNRENPGWKSILNKRTSHRHFSYARINSLANRERPCVSKQQSAHRQASRSCWVQRRISRNESTLWTHKRTNVYPLEERRIVWWKQEGRKRTESRKDGGLSAGGIRPEESVIPDDQRAADSALMSSSNDKWRRGPRLSLTAFILCSE